MSLLPLENHYSKQTEFKNPNKLDVDGFFATEYIFPPSFLEDDIGLFAQNKLTNLQTNYDRSDCYSPKPVVKDFLNDNFKFDSGGSTSPDSQPDIISSNYSDEYGNNQPEPLSPCLSSKAIPSHSQNTEVM